MNTEGYVAGLKASESDEITLTLTSLEWTAVGTLLSLAIDAGCPSEAARSARDKIVSIHRKRLNDEWPESIESRPPRAP